MARGRGKLTPHEIEAMSIVSGNLKRILEERNLKQSQVADAIKIPRSTFNDYVKGNTLPVPGNVQKIADYFGLLKSDIDPRFKSSNTTSPSPTVLKLDKDLHEPRHGQWVQYGNELLEEQKQEERKDKEKTTPQKGIVSELFEQRRKEQLTEEEKSLHAITGTTATAAASGLGRGYGYDDTDTYTVYTDEQPPKKYTFATMVKGDSMMPEFKDGDMLYLHDKGISSYSGMLAVVAYGDRTYFKKIYTENDTLRLVSLNEKYDDILLDFPPSEDTHIKIFEVVGSFTPVDKG